MKREKEGHYITIQGSIQEEDITIINITNMKGEINSNTIIVGDFNTHSHLWIEQLNRKLTRKHKI